MSRAADYVSLTKPRVLMMILLATTVGFVMASASAPDLLLLAHTLVGTALVAAGTLALNQYLEQEVDARMRRTRDRPLPAGRMLPLEALVFGGGLTCAGLPYLTFLVNPVSSLVTALTVIGYLFLYTPLKTRSALCTVAGAFPGALPPVTGWTAAGGDLGIGAAALFGILFFWQLPHSLAIAHIYRDDYEQAGVRLLPTVDRDGGSTGRQVALNSLALLAAGMLPTVIGLAGWVYLLVASLLGGWMLAQGMALALSRSTRDARRLLLASYLYVPIALGTMALDKV